jgi:phosphomannomutase
MQLRNMSAPTLPPAALPAFKAYDVRGRVPNELNEDLAWRIGQAYAEQFMPKNVVIGRDVRISSAPLAEALSNGLRQAGVDVFDIGLCGTEEVYFSTVHLDAGGGIMVTASHNPPDYNGLKFVRRGAKPVSADTGLKELEARVIANRPRKAALKGRYERTNPRDAYVRHMLSYIDPASVGKIHLVVNAGNGCAGPAFDAIAAHLPIRVTRLFHEPQGMFPNGVPNPLLPEKRTETAAAVLRQSAQLGIAWDGDFDRCFLFDERGEFIEGYYIVGLLAQAFLRKQRGAKIVHDPRLTWNTLDIVTKAGGVPVLSRCGHAFIKDAMRNADAIYGGEMSAHHYFRDFAYCDSGMIPWLLVLELLSASSMPMSEILAERIRLFPVSGEINRSVTDGAAAMRAAEDSFQTDVKRVTHFDGLSMEFTDWRFNLRPSNTEPLLRLNVESRSEAALVQERTAEILELLAKF